MSEYDPDDLRTHYEAWRKAIEIARDSCKCPPGVDDRAYWEHELKVFDRTMLAITGGPDGNPLADVKVTRRPAAAPLDHPDGPGGWWGNVNPWAGEAINVPVADLAMALGHGGVPGHWLSYSAKLDAYLLRQPGGGYLAGVRYGPEGGDYLSLNTYRKDIQDALRDLAENVPASGASSPRP